MSLNLEMTPASIGNVISILDGAFPYILNASSPTAKISRSRLSLNAITFFSFQIVSFFLSCFLFIVYFLVIPSAREESHITTLQEILHFACATFRMTAFPRAIARQGISMSSRTRHRRCEGSRAFTRFGGDASRSLKCHSEPRPVVECEESPPSYSKRWRLYSRLAGDASLSLSMTYAWG